MGARDGLERVRQALDKHGVALTHHQADGSWRGRCPVHEGQTRTSLSVRHHVPAGSDRGRAQLRCWGGCDERDVLDLVGLTLGDLYDDPPPKAPGRVTREHVYLAADTSLVGVVRRTEPKSFRPATLTAHGSWQARSSDDLKRLPYRLPSVVDAVAAARTVYIPEGERDCDALAAVGVTATCNAGGAGKWTADHAHWLKGADVVVCRDRDEAGRKHADAVVASLQGVAMSVRLVEPAEGKDVAEHLAAGRSVADLVPVDIPTANTALSRPKRWTASELMAAQFPEPKWAVPNLIPMGLTVLAGPPKVGKSWLTLGLGVAIATGGKALDYQAVEKGPVLYLALEDSPIRLQNRLEDLLGDTDAPHDLHLWPTIDRGIQGLAEIDDWLTEHPTARMVIVDVLQRFRGEVGGRNEDRYAADYAALTGLKAVGDRHQVAVVVVHHTRKSSDGDFLQEVSGTNGIAGSADTIIVLRRNRTEAAGTLAITGRDVLEDEHDVEMTGCHWRMLTGPAVLEQMAPTRRVIFDAVRSFGKPARPVDIATKVGGSRDTIRKTMHRMADAAELHTDGRGRYWVPAELGHLWDTPDSAVPAGLGPAGTPGTPGTPSTASTPTAVQRPPSGSLSQVSQNRSDQQEHTSQRASQASPSLSQKDADQRVCPRCRQPTEHDLILGRCRERCAYTAEQQESA